MHSQKNNSGDINPILDFDLVNFSYPGTPILKDVTFQVFQGEFIGIIGPNGGGKTTLLKLILGLLQPSSGIAKVFGHNVSERRTHLHRLAYVPQSARFDRDFPISVEEVVLSGIISKLPWYGRFKKTDRQLAFEVLEKVGLTHLSEKSFGTLSGGQAQRVLIARALISKPELLLLDEPTSSVDNQAEADIYTLLKQLKDQLTILMVTHDLSATIDQVERVFCIQRSVLSLKPEEVCKHFAFGLYHKPLLQDNSSK